MRFGLAQAAPRQRRMPGDSANGRFPTLSQLKQTQPERPFPPETLAHLESKATFCYHIQHG
jgi:hypothetical protein